MINNYILFWALTITFAAESMVSLIYGDVLGMLYLGVAYAIVTYPFWKNND